VVIGINHDVGKCVVDDASLVGHLLKDAIRILIEQWTVIVVANA
jgi:hypothetical protein